MKANDIQELDFARFMIGLSKLCFVSMLLAPLIRYLSKVLASTQRGNTVVEGRRPDAVCMRKTVTGKKSNGKSHTSVSIPFTFLQGGGYYSVGAMLGTL